MWGVGFSRAPRLTCSGLALTDFNFPLDRRQITNIGSRGHDYIKVSNKKLGEIFGTGKNATIRSVSCRRSCLSGICLECQSLLRNRLFKKNLQQRVTRANKASSVSRFTNVRFKPQASNVAGLGELSRKSRSLRMNLVQKSKTIEKLTQAIKVVQQELNRLTGRAKISLAKSKVSQMTPAEVATAQMLIGNVGNERSKIDEVGRRLFRSLYLVCKPRGYEFLRLNLNGPAVRTIQQYSALDGINYEFKIGGPSEDCFRFVGEVYRRISEKCGYVSKIGAELCEDETRVTGRLAYDEANDCIVGLCGSVSHSECDPEFSYVSLTGLENDIAIEKILNAASQEPATYARAVVVNPCNRKFPRLTVMLQGTCLRFDSSYVQNQWDAMEALYKKYIDPYLGPLIAHASDGDSRRRKLFLEYLGNRSFKQILESEDNIDSHVLADSDYLHCGKKNYNQLDSSRALLVIGKRIVSMNDLI